MFVSELCVLMCRNESVCVCVSSDLSDMCKLWRFSVCRFKKKVLECDTGVFGVTN